MATYGTVVGRYFGEDGITPAQGSVILTPAPAWLLYANSSPSPLTVVPDQVIVPLDATGSLSVQLLSTDDPAANPSGWTWQASIALVDADPWSFSFALPTGSTVDLTLVSPVNGSLGNAVVVGPPGGVGAPHRPDHSYIANDIVQHSDGSWLTCITAHTSTSTIDLSKFTPVSIVPGSVEQVALSATYVAGPQHGSNLGTSSLAGGIVTVAVTSKWSIDASGNVDYSDTFTTPSGYSPAALSLGNDGGLYVTRIPA